MTNKEKAEKFTVSVNEFAKDGLKQKEDVIRILEQVFEHNLENDFDDAIFSAKYTQGLLRIFQNSENQFDDEYLSKMKTEFVDNVQKVRDFIVVVAEKEGGFLKSIYEEKYLAMTHDAMQNINQLCYDFSWIKMYKNDMK